MPCQTPSTVTFLSSCPRGNKRFSPAWDAQRKIGRILEIFPIYSLISLAAIPLIIKSGVILRQNFDKIQELVPAMANTITFSRVTGALFVIGFILTL